MCAGVDVPINADFESGFASAPEGVAESVTLAIATGVAGLSIEDRRLDSTSELYEHRLAVARIEAAIAPHRGSAELLVAVLTG